MHLEMRGSLAAVFVVSLLLAGPEPAAAAGKDDDSIRAVVRTYLEAREKRDDKLLATVFAEDVDQLVSSGEWRRGLPDLVKGTLASSARETGRRTVEIETIRYITKDVAIADGRYTIAGDANARRMWSTFVMKRVKGGWKVSAIRNMLPTVPDGRRPVP
jgi:uncharacterized protein (TIGR02246 family)